MFDKRDIFNCHIARMLLITSNIPSIIFYSSTMSEFVRIARSKLLLKYFLLVAENRLDWMINQGGSKRTLLKLSKYLKAF